MENKWVKNYDLYNSKTSDIDYIEKAYAYLFNTKNNISDKSKQKEIQTLLDAINEHRQKALELNKNIKTDKISLTDKINIETNELPMLRKNVNDLLIQYKNQIDLENKSINNPNISNELKEQVKIRKKDNEIINKKLDNYLEIIHDNKETLNTESTKQEEVKQDTNTVVNDKNKVEWNTIQSTTIQTGAKLPEYRWRKLVYDEKDPNKLLWFISKKTNTLVPLQNWEKVESKIDEWIKWYTDFKNKTKEYLNQFEWDEKDKAKKQIEKKVFDPWTWIKSWDEILWD